MINKIMENDSAQRLDNLIKLSESELINKYKEIINKNSNYTNQNRTNNK